MALNTGKKITRRNWNVIPMLDLVIARVNALRSDQPKQLTFTDRHGRLIGDVDIPGNQGDSVANGIEFPGVDPVIHDDIEIPGVDDVEGLEDPNPQEIEIDDLNIHEPDPAPRDIETVQEATIQPSAPVQEPAHSPELRQST
jgi:hypothetical protein